VRFTGVKELGAALADQGYLADEGTCTILFLARSPGKPLLVEGPAGVG